MPTLRAFGRSLTGDPDRADDLVQETLAKAIANQDKYTEGSNLNAWLITILRNQYYTEGRKRRREVADTDGVYSSKVAIGGRQFDRMELRDFLAALHMLADDQREALVLIGVTGLSYEDAAEVLGVRVGTVKSRVSRARARLIALMDGDNSLDRSDAAIDGSVSRISQALGV
ncbi:MAG: sigma-70 family RNA polymerase sigma factor [Geminicoccaceae bacterium]